GRVSGLSCTGRGRGRCYSITRGSRCPVLACGFVCTLRAILHWPTRDGVPKVRENSPVSACQGGLRSGHPATPHHKGTRGTMRMRHRILLASPLLLAMTGCTDSADSTQSAIVAAAQPGATGGL